MGRSDSKMLIAKIDARGKAEKEMLLFKVSTWEKYFGKLLKNPFDQRCVIQENLDM